MRNLTTLTLLTVLSTPVLAEQITLNKAPKAQSDEALASNMTFSFENDSLPEGWQSEDDSWTITTEQSSDGEKSIKSESGEITWTADFSQGYLSFDVKGDGPYFKGQRFSIYFDNSESLSSFSQAQWQTFSLDIPNNVNSITIKKLYVFFNEGPIYIDNIRFIPYGQDSDLDNMPDQWALENGLNYNNGNDVNLDPDQDGLTNLQEYQKGTDPNYYDSDGDDVNDSQDSEPLNPSVQ